MDQTDPILAAFNQPQPPSQAPDDTDPISGAFQKPKTTDPIADAVRPPENPQGSWLGGVQNTWSDEGKGMLSKALTFMTEGEQAIARGAVNLLSQVGAMDPQASKQLLQQNEVHGHDIMSYYWKKGGGDDGSDPSRISEGIFKFGAGLGLDILMDPLTYLGIGLTSKLGKTAEVAGQTFSNLDKLSSAERLQVQSASKIEKVINEAGNVVDVPGRTAQEAAQQNSKLLADFANRKIGSNDLFDGLQNLSEGVKEEVQAAHQDTITQGWFDKWATGEKGLSLGVHVPFTNYGFQYDVPVASMVTKPTREFMSNLMGAAAKSGLVDNSIVRGLGNITQSVLTKTGYPLFDAMKNKWFGLKNDSDDLANDFMKEWYPKLKDQDLEQLSFLSEYYVPNPEEKAETWSQKTGQEFYDSGLSKLNEKYGMNTEEALTGEKTPLPQEEYENAHVDLLNQTLSVQAKEKERLLQKFTFDPEVVKKKFPEFSGIDDTSREFLERYHAEMDARVQEMNARPGLKFQELDPRQDGSANQYLMHKISEDWWENRKDTAQAVEYMFDSLEKRGLLVDRNNLGREYRGYIADANEKSLGESGKVGVGRLVPEEEGFKKFMDDPVYLASQRMKAMDRDIRNYDLMDTAGEHGLILEKGQDTPQGYILSKRKDFGGVDEAVVGEFSRRPEDEVRRSSDGYIWRRFVPPSWTENEGRLALPERLYNSLIDTVNPRQYSNFTQSLLDMNDKFMRVFRNTALFGPGYLGMKMSSDMLNYLTSGHFANPIMGMVDAVRALHPLSEDGGTLFHFVDHMGEEYQLTQRELYSTMVENNVVRSSLTQSRDFVDVAENIASTKEARDSMGQKIKTAYDVAMLWKLNRAVTKFAEDIPKAAMFIDRLRGGFSPEGAAEAAEKVFGNFNNQNFGARMINRVFPFTSVAIKTLEGTVARALEGEFAQLTIPGKVQSILQGAFVPDHDERSTLTQMLPQYYKDAIDRLHGPLLPGQREVSIEIPWVLNTLHFFMDPHENVHPLGKLLGAWATSKDGLNFQGITQQENMARSVGDSIGRFVPSYLKSALAVAELNGIFNFGGALKEGLLDNFGSAALGLDALDVRIPYSDHTKALSQSFGDAVEFGKYLEENRGDSWLYDVLFPKIDPETAIGKDAYSLAQRGKFIQSHFRDLTLGFAQLTDMDKNVAINMGAMQRQTQKLMGEYKEDIAKRGLLASSDMNPEQLQEAAQNNPKLKEALQIKAKMSALHDYYDWYVGVEKKYSGINPWKLLFGEYSFKNTNPLPPLKELQSLPAGDEGETNE